MAKEIPRDKPILLFDGVYDVVASSRYSVFGKKDHCMLPTPELRERFLGTDDLRATLND